MQPTGSVYTQIGKVRPLALSEKNKNAIEMFSKIGDEGIKDDEQCADTDNLVYGQKSQISNLFISIEI